jgi:hypothetical protein
MKHSNCDTFLLLSRVDTSAGGLLVPEGIISQVVGVSSLKWFIRYIYYLNLNLRSKQNSENITIRVLHLLLLPNCNFFLVY